MNHYKVMLVDDDSTTVKLLKALLEYEGFEVAILESDESLSSIQECIQEKKPEILYLDVHLRNVSGFDLLHNLRADPTTKYIRVLMSSGMDLHERCIREGADHFILKPYMPEDLINSIKQTIEE